MNRLVIFVPIVLIFSGLGCQEAYSRFVQHRFEQSNPGIAVSMTVLEARITGLLVTNGANHTFVDFEHSLNLGGATDTVPIAADMDFTSRDIVKVKVDQQIGAKIYDYTALIGPHRNSKESVTARIRNSAPTVSTDGGWVYAVGQWPVIIHNQVSAGAEGSTLILEVDSVNASIVGRVYFLHRTLTRTIKVRHYTAATERDLTLPGTYVEVSTNGDISQPALITDASVQIQAFVAYVKAMAFLAGLPAN